MSWMIWGSNLGRRNKTSCAPNGLQTHPYSYSIDPGGLFPGVTVDAA